MKHFVPQTEKAHAATRSIWKFKERARQSIETHGFKTFIFTPTEASATKIIKLLKSAIKENWSHDKIVQECAKQKLTKGEQAFALNFAHVYWPAFESEKDLRESPKQMVGYLLEEQIAGIKSIGYASYFVSLLAQDGSPAGIATGAYIDVNKIHAYHGLAAPAKQINVNFVGYVALPKPAQRKGADNVLLLEAEKYANSFGIKSDFFIAQVDKPLVLEMERQKLMSGKKKASAKKIAEIDKRIVTARADLFLWMKRYGMATIDSMKSMEIIPEKGKGYGGKGQSHVREPSKQPQLELILRSYAGDKRISLEDLIYTIGSLYLYYEVNPNAFVKNTKLPALMEYIEYSIGKVKSENGFVKLNFA